MNTFIRRYPLHHIDADSLDLEHEVLTCIQQHIQKLINNSIIKLILDIHNRVHYCSLTFSANQESSIWMKIYNDDLKIYRNYACILIIPLCHYDLLQQMGDYLIKLSNNPDGRI